MRHVIALLAATSALVAAAPALAEIKIDQAQISEGKLVIVGRTSTPRALVTLDDNFSTTASSSGRFQFGIIYIPAQLHRHAQGRD